MLIPGTRYLFIIGPGCGNDYGPGPFLDYGDYSLVKRLLVSWDDTKLKHMEYTLSDGRQFVRGIPAADNPSAAFEFNLDRGEALVSAGVGWTTWGGGRADFFTFTTTLGNVFKAGPGWWGGEYLQHSPAFLGGFNCRAGSDIDSIALLYTDQVVGYTITNVEYDLPSVLTTELPPVFVSQAETTNESDTPQTSTISYSSAVATTTNWTDTVGLELGVAAEFQAGIPLIGEGKVTVTEKQSFSHTWGEETSNTITETYSTSVVTPPRSKLVAQFAIKQTKTTIGYSADVTISYGRGLQQQAKLTGEYVVVAGELSVTDHQTTPL